MKTFKTILAVLFLATFLFACEAESLEVVNSAIQDDIDLKTTQLNNGDIVTRSEDEDDMPEPDGGSEDEDDMPEPEGADSEDEDDMPEPEGADSEDEDDMPEPEGL